MTRRNKYAPGRHIRTFAALLRELQAGRYVYERRKPQHPEWIMWRPLATLIREVRNGVYRYAKGNDDDN